MKKHINFINIYKNNKKVCCLNYSQNSIYLFIKILISNLYLIHNCLDDKSLTLIHLNSVIRLNLVLCKWIFI